MASLGLRLTVLAGPSLPVPLPGPLTARVRSVEVTENDSERSVFTLTLDAGRSATAGAVDVPGLIGPPLTAFSRVVVVVHLGVVPFVLSDGIVTEVKLAPGDGPGAATLSVTGEDVSCLLDREERDVEHPAMDAYAQVLRVLAPYAARGVLPRAVPPAVLDPPLPIDRIPTQHGTDLAHLNALARDHGHVAYAMPGPAPGTSTFYWGPAVRTGPPQPALSVDLGPQTNVTEIHFRTEALGPVAIQGKVMDRQTGLAVPVVVPVGVRPPLAAVPFAAANLGQTRVRRLRGATSSTIAAYAEARAEVDRSLDAVIAEGRLDGVRYGAVLRPRALVGVRGAGWSHDGLWYVREVRHELTIGGYQASFVLARDGHGALTPVLPVGGVI
ncbi:MULTISPECIES: hypothetical protein [Streptomyces]|uniref:hypothetical protein n=1 Tax=Streptomyces TaxID=1883 RepID=UPI000CF2C344|nr:MULTISPECIES: hypothetical protein [Streptomyces]PPS67837.1 hypothetical protein BV882_35955 [Streptomyces sp. 46]